MARSGPDTATRVVFDRCIGDQPELDFGGKRNADGQGFAVFGRVVAGMDVVKKIQAAHTGTAGAYRTETLEPPIKIDPGIQETLMAIVAVIGASADPTKFGNKALRAFRHHGYTVIPINPNAKTVEGEPAYASVLDYPGPIDEATVYVPPDIGVRRDRRRRARRASRRSGSIRARTARRSWRAPGRSGSRPASRARFSASGSARAITEPRLSTVGRPVAIPRILSVLYSLRSNHWRGHIPDPRAPFHVPPTTT